MRSFVSHAGLAEDIVDQLGDDVDALNEEIWSAY